MVGKYLWHMAMVCWHWWIGRPVGKLLLHDCMVHRWSWSGCWDWLCAINFCDRRCTKRVCMSTTFFSTHVHRLERLRRAQSKSTDSNSARTAFVNIWSTDLGVFREWFSGTNRWWSNESGQRGQHSSYAHQTFAKHCFYEISECVASNVLMVGCLST